MKHVLKYFYEGITSRNEQKEDIYNAYVGLILLWNIYENI